MNKAIKIAIIPLLLLLFLPLSAQRTVKVDAEDTYYAPSNVSRDEARRIVLERAKIKAIADEFGTIVTKTDFSFIQNRSDGNSSSDFMSLGESDVKGEWIETIGEPEYDIKYYPEEDVFAFTVKVEGRIREIVSPGIDIDAKLTKVTPDLRFEVDHIKDGESMYLYFKSPVKGYAAVYFFDEPSMQMYNILPYQEDESGSVEIKGDKPYFFFSKDKKHCIGSPDLVDECYITATRSQETNAIYVVFSPNKFTRANCEGAFKDEDGHLRPRQLSFADFQKWLGKLKRIDKDAITKKIVFRVTK